MIIKSIIKVKDDYMLTIDSEDIKVDENTIVKYNLYVNKEISNSLLDEILLSYSFEKNYNMALKYAIKYNKSKRGIYYYLIEKNVEQKSANEICNLLEEKKIINDFNLASNYVISCIHKSYGKYMIIKKLKDIFISEDVIAEVISNIDLDIYYEFMNKYIGKNSTKYDKYPTNTKKLAVKNDLIKRGYTTDDLYHLNNFSN